MSVSSLEKKIKKLSEQILEYRKKSIHYTKELKETKSSLSKAIKNSKKGARVIKGGDGENKICSQEDDTFYDDSKQIGLLVETFTKDMNEKSNVVHLAVSIDNGQFNAINIKAGDRVFFTENKPTIEIQEIRNHSIEKYKNTDYIILSVEKIDNNDREYDQKDIIFILDKEENLERDKQYYMYHTIHPILKNKKTCDDREFVINHGYTQFFKPYIVSP